MATRVPRTLLGFCAALLSMSIGTPGYALQPEYGVCDKQIVTYVEQQLQQHVIRLDVTYPENRLNRNGIPLDRGAALVYVDGCDGYHVFDVLGTEYDCLYRPHYGRPAMYVWYRTSSGDC